jgi:hypothetical protein
MQIKVEKREASIFFPSNVVDLSFPYFTVKYRKIKGKNEN